MSNDAKFLFVDFPLEVRVQDTTPEALEAALVRVNRYVWILADQLRKEREAAVAAQGVKK